MDVIFFNVPQSYELEKLVYMCSCCQHADFSSVLYRKDGYYEFSYFIDRKDKPSKLVELVKYYPEQRRALSYYVDDNEKVGQCQGVRENI